MSGGPSAPTTSDVPWEYMRLVAPSLLSAAAMVGLGFWAAVQLGIASFNAAAIGVLIALPGSLLGNLLPAVAVGRAWKVLTGAVLAGLGVRFLVTATLFLVGALILTSDRDATLIWAGAAQLVLLAVDVAGQLRLGRLAAGAQA